MDYIKTTWKNGDVITAEKLNNIEDGIDGIRQEISNAPLVITMDEPKAVGEGKFCHTKGGLTVNELATCIFKMASTKNGNPSVSAIYIGSAVVQDDSYITLRPIDGGVFKYYPTTDNKYGDTGLLLEEME